MIDYEHSSGIERAVARHFDYRRHLCVANASWGAGVHECDLLLLTKSGFGIEVEIKISRSDIIADRKKAHHLRHGNDKIKKLFFAIPVRLSGCANLIPQHAGIISVDARGRCEIVRAPQTNANARPWTEREQLGLARLGTMRFWYRWAPPVEQVRMDADAIDPDNDGPVIPQS